MAEETLSCTGCGAPLNSVEDYCTKCGRKSVHLPLGTSESVKAAEADSTGETAEGVAEPDFIIFGNAVVITPEERAQYLESQSYELPPLNIYDWIFTPAEAWDRRPDAMRPGGWAWYIGLCSVGAVLAMIVLNVAIRPLADRQSAQAPVGGTQSVLGAPSVTGPIVSAPVLTPPSVSVVPYTPTQTTIAPLYRIENGHYAVLSVEEERKAAREAVAWEQQGQLSATTRRTDSLVKAADRKAARDAFLSAQDGMSTGAETR